MGELSHIDSAGRASMVDVGSKAVTHRSAVAEARVLLPTEVLQALVLNELHTAKGSVFQVAMIAGIQAAKRTGDLIPLCHPLGLDTVDVQLHLDKNEVVIRCSASLHGKTGVEMEALTGASLAALVVYDMCKALSHDIVVKEIKLIEKKGGRRDFSREG